MGELGDGMPGVRVTEPGVEGQGGGVSTGGDRTESPVTARLDRR